MAEDDWEDKLYFSLSDLEEQPPQVLIVGSGPAGTAVAEYLYEECEDVTIGILERGTIFTVTHIINSIPLYLRGAFIEAMEQFPWDGAFAPKEDAQGKRQPETGGMMIFALGGRGIVAGAHLRRFYKDDFRLWNQGQWPVTDLAEYYDRAERVRNVSFGESEGRSQTWTLGRLEEYNASPPSWGLDIRSNRNKEISRGYDSSAARLWDLVLRDYVKAKVGNKKRRLFFAPQAYVTQIAHDRERVRGFVCREAQDPRKKDMIVLGAEQFVLAASPIESARLFLNSGLGEDRPAAGRYLAEHIYCRGLVTVNAPDNDPHEQYVNVVVPPQRKQQQQRFQIHVQGDPVPGDPTKICYRLTGEAAMDPQRENRVTVDGSAEDEYGVKKATVFLEYSPDDATRLNIMKNEMRRIANELGGNLDPDKDLKVLAKGRSHHEAGTLRMGHPDQLDSCVTDSYGQVYNISNLFVADASLFPCVGVANPMLTITALAYRVAEKICTSLKQGQSATMMVKQEEP
ncbi:MAG: GMC family oxidoreductase [Blastocatellia bacterium]|nr:GMC family oxidoreductase [Blastocatellia bacterium]